jgi:short-subunit dehydrogenase
MDDNFKDKTVIITGGSEGVGAATARKFASLGANLLLVARGKRKLERIAEELRDKTKVEIMAMDVADADACANIYKKAVFEFGSVDILVNNAGYHERGPVESIPANDLAAMIDVNLKAPILLSKLAIKYMKESGGGAIINVGSLAGRTPVPGAATYSATKFGLRAFTFALGEELRDSGIKLAVVSPGTIMTGFITSNFDAVADVNFSQPIVTVEEVAQAIVNLVTDNKRERVLPASSGVLTTLSYVFPGLWRLLLPLLIRKGRRVKRKLKAQMRQAEREQES